jgi:acetyl-CoA C-acetyltransferase
MSASDTPLEVTMSRKPRVGVVGVAVRPCVADDGRHSLEELQHEAMRAALADAGLGADDLEGIVCGCNDQYDGRAISVMMASGPLGGVDRDILSTPSAGEHAFVLGALRVASGQVRTQLVAAWSPTEAAPLAEAQRLAMDPYFHRRLPLDELAAHALQACALEHAVPEAPALAREVLAKNRANGARAFPDLVSAEVAAEGRPTRWPLREGMVAAPVTGVAALMLASEEFVRERGLGPVAWISGMGWATEPAFLGDRDLSRAPALEAAAAQAYGEAGVADVAAFELAEVTDTTPHQELLACEALGLAPRSEWRAWLRDGAFGPDGRLPVNLSGGALSLNPVYCTGLIRIAEVANQLRGRAGRHQKPGARRGVAHAASGPAMQYQTVVVFESGAAA